MLETLKATSSKENPLLDYHNYDELTELLTQYSRMYPHISSMFTLGRSVAGRELWGLRITDNPTQREAAEPEFIYLGNMHGDETVGREMLVNLIVHLLTSYGNVTDITQLIDTTDIYIVPSINPDGFERGRRANDNGFDLNRNFPDRFQDPNNDPAGRQPETQAVMYFWDSHNFVLSANLHGGAVCVNYPYDDFSTPTQCGRAISYAPDHDLYVDLSLTYSRLNEPMYNSNEFDQGITNGAEWYCISGSMQDWSYVWYSTLHVTIELSNVKYPAASQLGMLLWLFLGQEQGHHFFLLLVAGFWEDNRDAMIAYLKRAHLGLRGRVSDATTGEALKAHVEVKPVGKEASALVAVRTDNVTGDYFRVLLPGTYTVTATVPSKAPQTKTVQVPEAKAAVLDFAF